MTTIDVDGEIEKLQPSLELLAYYREKIHQFKSELERLNTVITRYQKSSCPCWNPRQIELDDQVHKLQCDLSEIKLLLNTERQLTAKLHLERQICKTDQSLCQKKLSLLLHVTGLSEKELTVYAKANKLSNLKNRKLSSEAAIKVKALKQIVGESEGSYTTDNDSNKISELEERLRDVEKTWVEERGVLTEEKRKGKEERKLMEEKMKAQVTLLNSKLEERNTHVSQLMHRLVKSQIEAQEAEIKWLSERDQLLNRPLSGIGPVFKSKLHSLVPQPPNLAPNIMSSDDHQIRQLKRNINQIKRELHDSENENEKLMKRSNVLENDLSRLKGCYAKMQQEYKEKSLFLSRKTEFLTEQHEKFERRMKSQILGFHSDLRLLRQDLKTLVQQIYKLLSLASSEHPTPSPEILDEAKLVTQLVRKINMNINATKRGLLGVGGKGNEKGGKVHQSDL